MAAKEAKARIKINKLLEESGWRFFDDASGKSNVVLEPNVKLTKANIDSLGENFESIYNGFVDFLLLDAQGHPLVVLEAKAEDKNPLIGKEQARNYAKSQNCRFVILSNGNLHFFWDLEQGNPHIITRFPSPDSIKGYHRFQLNPQRLITELITKDYIALTQMPGYANEAGWKSETERPAFTAKNRLRFLRDYQKRAVQALQDAVAEGQSRFLFEMATGTGKTLTAAAVIKLFLRTGNAQRVLFQNYMQPVIHDCLRHFLLESLVPDEREYYESDNQIREVLIHANYFSQKDIEVCLAFDIGTLADNSHFSDISALFFEFVQYYKSENE